MNNPVFDNESVKMLLALRTRTVRGIKNDFRGMFPDVACPVGCGNTDTLQHILTCSVLQNNLQSEALANQMIKFEDIFFLEAKNVVHPFRVNRPIVTPILFFFICCLLGKVNV